MNKKTILNGSKKIPLEIMNTAEGSHTLYRPDLDEVYHSRYGAVQESTFVYIQNGYSKVKEKPINIFEVGFGTGLNALLTCIESNKNQMPTKYTTIEKYPLKKDIIRQLNYPGYLDGSGNFFHKIHEAPWNQEVNITQNFSIQKINKDLVNYDIDDKFHLIYFDAFAPDVQPELWRSSVFKKMADALYPDGILVTYAARSSVFRALEKAGFKTQHIPGPPGKREITVAIKI
jgi:tRNA U34 5-methylaminomethyl-2-thiouridine-forming methyltransferase MnmC